MFIKNFNKINLNKHSFLDYLNTASKYNRSEVTLFLLKHEKINIDFLFNNIVFNEKYNDNNKVLVDFITNSSEFTYRIDELKYYIIKHDNLDLLLYLKDTITLNENDFLLSIKYKSINVFKYILKKENNNNSYIYKAIEKTIKDNNNKYLNIIKKECDCFYDNISNYSVIKSISTNNNYAFKLIYIDSTKTIKTNKNELIYSSILKSNEFAFNQLYKEDLDNKSKNNNYNDFFIKSTQHKNKNIFNTLYNDLRVDPSYSNNEAFENATHLICNDKYSYYFNVLFKDKRVNPYDNKLKALKIASYNYSVFKQLYNDKRYNKVNSADLIYFILIKYIIYYTVDIKNIINLILKETNLDFKDNDFIYLITRNNNNNNYAKSNLKSLINHKNYKITRNDIFAIENAIHKDEEELFYFLFNHPKIKVNYNNQSLFNLACSKLNIPFIKSFLNHNEIDPSLDNNAALFSLIKNKCPDQDEYIDEIIKLFHNSGKIDILSNNNFFINVVKSEYTKSIKTLLKINNNNISENDFNDALINCFHNVDFDNANVILNHPEFQKIKINYNFLFKILCKYNEQEVNKCPETYKSLFNQFLNKYKKNSNYSLSSALYDTAANNNNISSLILLNKGVFNENIYPFSFYFHNIDILKKLMKEKDFFSGTDNYNKFYKNALSNYNNTNKEKYDEFIKFIWNKTPDFKSELMKHNSIMFNKLTTKYISSNIRGF